MQQRRGLCVYGVMSRRSLVIALAAASIAAVIAVALLLTMARQPAARNPSGTEAPGSVAPAAVGPLDPGSVGWVYAAPLFEGPANSYTLQAGTLDEPGPLVDLQVPFGLDPNSNPGRMPAVSAAVNGAVVYVADDGTGSSVRRVELARNALEEELATLDEVVYSAVVTPDGRHAYLALGDRVDPERDLGIVRLSLDGNARVERIFDPAAGASREPTIVLAAVVGFHVEIRLSLDGRHLVRYACAGPAGCASQVVDVDSGEITQMADRTVVAVAGGVALTQRCQAECVMELIDLESGALQRLPGVQFEAAMALVGGRPWVALVDSSNGEGQVLRALDPRDGSIVDIFRAPPGRSLMMSAAQGPVRLSLPDGYVLAAVSGDDVGAIVEVHTLAIPLSGGEAVELPPVPFRPEFGGAEG